MIKRPVKYDRQDMSIQDAEYRVIAHPWRKVGEPDRDFHERGQEIADCINGDFGIKQESPRPLPVSPGPVVEVPVEPAKPKRRGRPKKGV